jgi:hypothetical protein
VGLLGQAAAGRSPDWLKFKNPEAPAVKREAEEDWNRRRWRSTNETERKIVGKVIEKVFVRRSRRKQRWRRR